MNETTVKPIEGTETLPGTVMPDKGHGSYFEFTDDGAPIDVQTQRAIPVKENITVEPVVSAEPTEELLEPNFQELYGFDLESYDNAEELEQSGKPKPQADTDDKPLEPKKDPSQAEYWQSQADIRGSDLSYILGTLGTSSIDEFKANYKEYKNLIPIAKYIKSNPSIVDNIGQSLSNPMPGQPQEGNQNMELKPPVKPTRPSGYNREDAFQVSDSESFQYNEKLEQWRDDMFQYQNDIQVRNMQEAQTKMQQEQAAYQMEQTQAQLVNQYQFTPEDANKFVQYMSSPQSQSLDNLVMLWKMRNAPAGSIAQNLNKANDFKLRQEKMKNIKPGLGGATSGPKVRPLTPEEEFNISLMSRNRRK